MATRTYPMNAAGLHCVPRARFTVCHFTTVHNQLKSRSYHMQCKPLADAGIGIHFVSPAMVHDGCRNVNFVRLPARAGLVNRLTALPSLLRVLLGTRASLYHFQDPELLLAAFAMKLVFRKRIVFDCYEDFSSMAYTARGVPQILRAPLSQLTAAIQKFAAHCFDGFMTADPFTMRRVGHAGKSAKLTFYNFPNQDFFPAPRSCVKEFDLVYRGGLSDRAGTWLLLEAARLLAVRGRPIRLLLIGYCDDSRVESALRNRITTLGLTSSIELQGRIGHEQMAKILSRARIGICPLQDTPKFRVNIPVKVFEYWACGLPVIASDLPPIRPFFKNVGGGLLFAPGDVRALAQSIAWLLNHPQSADRMGQRGRAAIESRFTHRNEVRKLLKFFSHIAAST